MNCLLSWPKVGITLENNTRDSDRLCVLKFTVKAEVLLSILLHQQAELETVRVLDSD